ncbi:putative disease resistance RPP13-like protein 1 [Vigna unguiculata]|uniref:putative disease resistance RPP13-like protein 1 n=1 Tax=Vigna unguiculata TaxID=3917 RepID=UPI001015D26A|nr:putative disease resistance RPP13-like protein 1 [Vigna unguiculata]
MTVDHILHLSFLSDEHCWSLFSDHCFGNKSSCNPQLGVLGRRILSKCGGVPLAAKMLGGLLHKKDDKDWMEILNSPQWEQTNINFATPFVRLCYLSLPIQLKRCITYLGMFHKGYQFQKRQVVLLWIGKALIQREKNESMENLGNKYFDFLVARSFLIRSNSGDEADFTMHDTVRDLALAVSRKSHYLSYQSLFGSDYESIDTSFLISNIQNTEESSSELYEPQTEEYAPSKDNVGTANITHGLDQQSPEIDANLPTITNDVVQPSFESGTQFDTV